MYAFMFDYKCGQGKIDEAITVLENNHIQIFTFVTTKERVQIVKRSSNEIVFTFEME
jgi:hypothetical protein